MSDAELISPSEFVVKSKVKQLLREAEMRGSEEMWNELGHVVTRRVKHAIARAKANGRKTVKACDF